MGPPLVAALIAAGAIHFDAGQQYAAICADCQDHLRHWHSAAWSREYGAAVALLQQSIERASHRGDPRLFACAHGPPGWRGLEGRAGHWDLPGLEGAAIDITELVAHALGGRLDSGHRCDVRAAVAEIMERHLLPEFDRIDYGMPPGPPGPMGADGLSAYCMCAH